MRIIGIFLLLILLPITINWLRSKPHQRHWLFFAFGILPFLVNWANLDVAIISWAQWLGYVKGLLLSIIDIIAISVIYVNKRSWRNLPFLGLMLAYLLAAILSMLYSNLWMSSFFYVFQVVRIVLVFVAVSIYAEDPRALRWLGKGLAAGAIFQAVMSVGDLMAGMDRATGTMGHQNLLGMMLHFVTLPLVALLLAGERSKLIMFGVLASLSTVGLGASRASVGFVALGLVLLFILSLARHVTKHKMKIVGLGALAAVLVVPLTIQAFSERFSGDAIVSGPDEERQAFERAANAMWSDHPMGVGANQYVVTANSAGYSDRAGVHWGWSSRATNVHNVYLLAAAETGWAGLLTLSALFAWSVVRGLHFSFRNRKTVRGELVLGSAIAILTTALHSFYEWVFVLSSVQYLFAISLAVIAGSIRQTNQEKTLSEPRRVQLSARTRTKAGAPITEQG